MLRRSFIFMMFVLVAGLFQGCLPTEKPFVPAKVEPNKALVYVYRPDSIVARGSMWGLRVNGKVVVEVAKFINNGYIPLYIDAGDANIELIYKYGFRTGIFDEITLRDLKAGEVYYLKAFMEFGGQPHFELKDKQTGAKEIASSIFFEFKD